MDVTNKTKKKKVKHNIYMKTISRLFLIIIVTVGLVACDKDDEIIIEPELEVTYANIEGTWKLAEWNGEPTNDNTYLYVVFNRRDRSYEQYQKFDSMYARYITGSYKIQDNEDGNSIISGKYDFGMGKWNNSYIVTNLYESGSMIWTVEKNEADVSKYIRCDEVPAEIIAQAKP